MGFGLSVILGESRKKDKVFDDLGQGLCGGGESKLLVDNPCHPS